MVVKTKKSLISKSPLQTQNFAGEIIKNIAPANLICLYGELGAGKTTFVQGLAKALGIKKRILSPTFVLVRQYKIKNRNLYHIDCYRISSSKDLKAINLPELLTDKQNLVVIEWAEKIEEILPAKRIDIKFEYKGKNEREINAFIY